MREPMSRIRLAAGLCLFAGSLLLTQFKAVAESTAPSPTGIALNNNWQIQSSCEAKAAGEQISTSGFDAKGWHKTTVPNTVVGSLVDDKTYPDPTYGTNLKNLPGMNYSSATFFALQDM